MNDREVHDRLHFSDGQRVFSWLVRELKKRIPRFEPYGLDGRLAFFAQRDLETWLGIRWGVENRYKVRVRLGKYLSRQPEDVKGFLGFWVNRWLEKWRERVNILHNKPKIPKSYRERIRKAKMLYGKLDHRKELKRMVVRKLVNQGEICMISLVAENLIVREIARRIQAGGASKHIELNPIEILNSLSSRIARLPEENGALIHLKIRQIWKRWEPRS